ncbi:MAG: hypothetical protein JWM36_2715 [Hyphomicrobiales bacterium]|nr:hypothetical protein [Hyphomicrobiales bacterium]
MRYKRYRVIGDIHGHADALRRLLAKIDYRKVEGVYRHENRRSRSLVTSLIAVHIEPTSYTLLSQCVEPELRAP